MSDETSRYVSEHARSHCALFPGSKQVQTLPWSQASLVLNRRDGSSGLPSDKYDGYFYLSVNHSDLDPEWPISTDWPAVVRGLRGSLNKTQAEFAELLQLGRATVERWEAGTAKPFRGNGLELLTLLRPHLENELQAGQVLNVAASVVLPHITQPTAEYSGQYLARLLNDGKHHHDDLAPAMLAALSTSRILVAIESTGDELEDTYFPLAARLHPAGELPRWAADLVDRIMRLDRQDQGLITNLVQRLEGETTKR